jgi:carbamoyl-phosphate synthase large subunit
MRVRNVLVLPAGTEIGQEILAALKNCKEVRLFGAGQDVSNHARFSYPEYHIVASVHEPGWAEQLAALCRTLAVDYIFPAHDDVIVALAREAARIPAAIVSSPLETCEITRSKSATYRRLCDALRVPRLYPAAAAVDAYPVLVKPDRGQGSAGVSLARDPCELAAALAQTNEPIVCEYLPGEEYTVDCFSDRERGLLFAGARQRRRTRNGIAINTITVPLPESEGFARTIAQRLPLHGAWFFQLKRAAGGELALLEVAPRIAGSMAANRVRGVNFPLLSIFEQERLPLAVRADSGAVELDRTLSNRYRHDVSFAALYVDFDDTLILNGAVNTAVVKLIFQCVNRGIPVKLLTRHAGDLAAALQRHRLGGLFDDIIHIKNGEPKSRHIAEADAILVDDSFAERTEAAQARNIRTFDGSMIELLTEEAASLHPVPSQSKRTHG